MWESDTGDSSDTGSNASIPGLMEHPLGVIIASIAPPKGIRFTISRNYFKRASNYAELPERLLGEVDRWVKKDEGRATVLWPADASNTIEYLPNLFHWQMQLEPYEDGRSAPKAKGTTAKRLYAKLLRDLNEQENTADIEKVEVAYTEGTLSLAQVGSYGMCVAHSL
ncbi:MAG: hypothetical protein SGPRY_013260 [Prymnesium sp.]